MFFPLLCRAFVLAIVFSFSAAATALAQTSLSGPYFHYASDSNTAVPPTDPNNQYILAGNTGFGWKTSTQTYNININGFTLTVDTGGGNYTNLSGALTGSSGTFSLVSGGSAGPAILSGAAANTFGGLYAIAAGTNVLDLDKTTGVAAISGPVDLNSGTLQWQASNEVSDGSSITTAGGTTLNFGGYSDTVGTLLLAGGVSNINLNNAGIVTFADCSGQVWSGQEVIASWSGSLTGGGSNQILFGNSSSALTPAQLASISFTNPAGLAAGTYTAKILSTGEIVPNAPSTGPTYSWSGSLTNPNSTIGSGVQGVLSGDGGFGWQTGTTTIPINLNGHNFTMDNGGGNYADLEGAITGSGNVTFVGRGDLTWEGLDNWVGGSLANTYSGSTLVQSGWLQLDKPSGVIAIPGNLQIGNGSAPAGVKLLADNQIASNSAITLDGGTFKPFGHIQTMGTLDLIGDSTIDLTGGSSTIHFAPSNSIDWSSGQQLLVINWAGSASDQVYIGTSASGLTPSQIAKVGFVNPAGQAAGLYQANITSTGQIVPNSTAVQPIDPPFDLSASAQAARAAVYTSNGRAANLSGASTPLTAGEKISFFGDSITWLNGYVSAIGTALSSGTGTENLGVQLYNRGINGGGVLQVLDGSPNAAFDGGTNNAAQLPFASQIAADQSNVAVVCIGINDVVHLGTSAATFEQGLRSIVAAADAQGTKVLLATLMVDGEKPDGSNPYDTQIDQFAQITREVAGSTDATLLDLRQVYIDYLQNNNYSLQLNGSLSYQTYGILTYDGIHPNATGTSLLADQISQGLFVAAQPVATRVWSGSAGGGLWSSAANWSGGAIPYNDDPLTFTGSAMSFTSSNDLSAPPVPLMRVGLVTLAGNGLNISGGSLRLDAGIVNSGNNSWNLNSTLNAAQSFAGNGGTLTVGGSIDNSGFDLTIAGSGTTALTSTVTGTGSLIKVDSGTLILSGSNSYTGGTSVTDGDLILDGAQSICSGTSLVIGSNPDSGTVLPASSIASENASPPLSAVPEPGTLISLIAAAGISVFYFALRSSRR